jgi:hypothetical protein
MTLWGEFVQTREAQQWARNYEWLPYTNARFLLSLSMHPSKRSNNFDYVPNGVRVPFISPRRLY